MKAMTTFGLWLVCLMVFFVGLKLQGDQIGQNYLLPEDELILIR